VISTFLHLISFDLLNCNRDGTVLYVTAAWNILTSCLLPVFFVKFPLFRTTKSSLAISRDLVTDVRNNGGRYGLTDTATD
jgi:hypothetical protein